MQHISSDAGFLLFSLFISVYKPIAAEIQQYFGIKPNLYYYNAVVRSIEVMK